MFLRAAIQTCLETSFELRIALILFEDRDKFSKSNGVKCEATYLVLSVYHKSHRGE